MEEAQRVVMLRAESFAELRQHVQSHFQRLVPPAVKRAPALAVTGLRK
jgi:hypothetical protein